MAPRLASPLPAPSRVRRRTLWQPRGRRQRLERCPSAEASYRGLLMSWAAPVVALRLVSGAGQRFSTWKHSSPRRPGAAAKSRRQDARHWAAMSRENIELVRRLYGELASEGSAREFERRLSDEA